MLSEPLTTKIQIQRKRHDDIVQYTKVKMAQIVGYITMKTIFSPRHLIFSQNIQNIQNKNSTTVILRKVFNMKKDHGFAMNLYARSRPNCSKGALLGCLLRKNERILKEDLRRL